MWWLDGLSMPQRMHAHLNSCRHSIAPTKPVLAAAEASLIAKAAPSELGCQDQTC